jgi:hypothetical protein
MEYDGGYSDTKEKFNKSVIEKFMEMNELVGGWLEVSMLTRLDTAIKNSRIRVTRAARAQRYHKHCMHCGPIILSIDSPACPKCHTALI